MERKDIELLLKDLSSRLPYNVKCDYQIDQNKTIGRLIIIDVLSERVNVNGHMKHICDVKPYLFPLSSMTEERSKELEEIDPEFYSLICSDGEIYVSMDLRGYDWLNENHFDYRGLIPKGLALNATGLNIY
jgi:hypothetical protein